MLFQLHLNPYDAEALCTPCPPKETEDFDYNDYGDEVPVVNIWLS